MSPFFPEKGLKWKSPGCPYCYDGVVVFDKYSKVCCCTACQRIVKMEGLYGVADEAFTGKKVKDYRG